MAILSVTLVGIVINQTFCFGKSN